MTEELVLEKKEQKQDLQLSRRSRFCSARHDSPNGFQTYIIIITQSRHY